MNNINFRRHGCKILYSVTDLKQEIFNYSSKSAGYQNRHFRIYLNLDSVRHIYKKLSKLI